jgi:hypothetical protein
MSKGRVALGSWTDWPEWRRGLVQALGLSPTAIPDAYKPAKGTAALSGPLVVPAYMSRLPAALMYGRQRMSLLQVLQTALDAGKRVLPLYMSLNLVPTLLFRWRGLIRSPTTVLLRTLGSAAQSSAFIAAFVGSYMGVITTQKALFRGDHKLVYWLAGLVAGLSLLLERTSRHVDLMLYVLPRAADSLYTIMADRRWVATVPHGEVLLFALAMAVLLGTYEREQQQEEEQQDSASVTDESDGNDAVGEAGSQQSSGTRQQQRMMAPFLRSLLRFLLGPTPPLPRLVRPSALPIEGSSVLSAESYEQQHFVTSQTTE